jgi:NADPH:quinone reductase-like Zn-dependent oxidoreductase
MLDRPPSRIPNCGNDNDGMQAAGVRVLGGPVEQLELADPPEPGDGEVLIDVLAAGIGNWEDLVRTGDWDVGIRPPMALGVEAAGTVRAIGAGVSRFAAGDAVLVHSAPLRYQGAWAERFLANEADVAAKPASLDWPVAGALPVPLLTATQVVSDLACGPADVVFVHGGGGLTGGLLVLMAAQTGCRVVATGSPGSADRIRAYGAAEVVDHRAPAWQTQLHAASPAGFSVAINAVRGAAPSLLPFVADGGRLVTITGDEPASERGIEVRYVIVAPGGLALEAAADLVARVGPRVTITETASLQVAAGALLRVVQGSGGGVRVVDPRR